MHCQTDRQRGCFLWRHYLRIAYSNNVQRCNKDDFGNVQFTQNLNLQAVDSRLRSVSLQLFFPHSGIGRSSCQSTRYLAAFISWLHSVSLQPFFLCAAELPSSLCLAFVFTLLLSQNWKPVSSPLHTDLSFYLSITSKVCICCVCVCVLCVYVCVCVCARVCDEMSVSLYLCKCSELLRDWAP